MPSKMACAPKSLFKTASCKSHEWGARTLRTLAPLTQ